MAVPEATSIALTRALEGFKMSDGVGWPVGYQPCSWIESATGRAGGTQATVNAAATTTRYFLES